MDYTEFLEILNQFAGDDIDVSMNFAGLDTIRYICYDAEADTLTVTSDSQEANELARYVEDTNGNAFGGNCLFEA